MFSMFSVAFEFFLSMTTNRAHLSQAPTPNTCKLHQAKPPWRQHLRASGRWRRRHVTRFRVTWMRFTDILSWTDTPRTWRCCTSSATNLSSTSTSRKRARRMTSSQTSKLKQRVTWQLIFCIFLVNCYRKSSKSEGGGERYSLFMQSDVDAFLNINSTSARHADRMATSPAVSKLHFRSATISINQ